MAIEMVIYFLGEHDKRHDVPAIENIQPYYFRNQKIGKYGRENPPCYSLENNIIKSEYFIGVDWLCQASQKAIHITPKLNNEDFETDYLGMLLSCLKDPVAAKYIGKIYEIKTKEPQIKIDQSEDLLTPILVIQFLFLVKKLVKKGLKKSYYREEKHLNSKVKGKLLVSSTLKHNTFKNEPLKMVCAYDTFGLNHPENQLIKATLIFIKKYLAQFPYYSKMVAGTLNYSLPAFAEVSVPRNISEFRQFKTSPFFSNYKEAIELAKKILGRHGHKIQSVEARKIETPPFWINMALLFELYTFTLLRKTYGKRVKYQYSSDYQELDFLLNTENEKMVIDTKYKLLYGDGKKVKEDIRQLSGYARMEKVYQELGKNFNEVIDCLIIYPKRSTGRIPEDLDLAGKSGIDKYVGFFKVAVDIPYLKGIENKKRKAVLD